MTAEAIWDCIRLQMERPIFRRVSEDHPYDLYLGIDTRDAPVLMLISTQSVEHIPNLRALDIAQNVRHDGKFALLISLSVPGLLHPFCQVCEDLIESLRHFDGSGSAAMFLLTRLEKWRKLLESTRKGLSNAEIMGLLGELLFLERLMSLRGASSAIDSWLGPGGAPQDFQSGGHLYEIKACKVGSHVVTISSLDQLHTASTPTALIVFYLGTSAKSPSAFSPISLVSRIRNLVADPVALSTFDLKLAEVGFDETQRESSSQFIVEKERAFDVREGFPRLTPVAVPRAIGTASYTIDLDQCTSFEIPASQVLSR